MNTTENLKTVRSFIRRSNKWTAKCVAFRNEEKAGIEFGPAYDEWVKGGRPSKVAKLRAYEAADRIARQTGQPRPMVFADLEAIAAN